MGRPVQTPYIRCVATEVGQTGNVFDTIYFNLTDDECPLFFVPGLDPGKEKIYLPRGGEVNVSTSAAISKDGGKETWICFDETHLYTTPELKRLFRTYTRNLRKRKRIAQTWFLETTTMFQPGEESVAEATYGEAEAIREGRKKRGRARAMFDHRYGECKDLKVEADLRAAIMEAFGEAIAWNDIDAIVDEFYDTRSDPNSSRRFFLNSQTSASDAWVAVHELDACGRIDKALKKRDAVTMGLDGSLVDDATAIVITRLSDGHQELWACWEKTEDDGDDWAVDREEVDAKVAETFRYFRVVAFFCDPPHYGDYIAKWTSQYGARVQVYGQSKMKPFEWWTNRPTQMVQALQDYHEAILEERMTFPKPRQRSGGEEGERDLAVTFRKHILQARRNVTRAGLQIRKEFPKSPKKIDGCMAGCLSWAARNAAIAKGVKPVSNTNYAPKRIR
jgi:hypothetical protein